MVLHTLTLRRGIIAAACIAFSITSVFAQRPTSNNYRIPTDVQPVGGGEQATSTNYILDDTIGEANIGLSRSDNYDLNAGYRQTLVNFISLSCGSSVALGTIDQNGQSTGSGTCVVTTDADAGYSLSWKVSTGSGGANTGSMINQFEETIAPFSPTIVNTPDTWGIAAADSEWGARLRSSSTDTAAEWGTDNTSDKWLNVRTTARTIVTRSTRTSVSGSDEILQFRVEIGSAKAQPSGNYAVTVVMTATSL